jgi:hypothetical protein
VHPFRAFDFHSTRPNGPWHPCSSPLKFFQTSHITALKDDDVALAYSHRTMAADNGTAAKAEEKPKGFYDDVENLKKLCDFLRSGQGPPIREALLMEKRVHYLKGKKHARFGSSMSLGMRIFFSHSRLSTLLIHSSVLSR